MPGEVGEVTKPGGLGPQLGPVESSATAPTVEAGGAYSGAVSTAIQLAATVVNGTDGSPTLLWTIDSGGAGTFSDDSVEDPTFTPDVDDVKYTLRLTVTPSDTAAVFDTAVCNVGLTGQVLIFRRRRRV